MSYRTPAPLLTRVHVAARTDVGPMRMVNEDGYLVADIVTKSRVEETPFAGTIESDAGVVLAVIDGMGGHRSGEDATKIVADVFHAAMTTGVVDGDEAFQRRLVMTLNGASRAILTAAERNRMLMGSGAVAVLG